MQPIKLKKQALSIALAVATGLPSQSVLAPRAAARPSSAEPFTFNIKSVAQALDTGRVDGAIIPALMPSNEAWVRIQSNNTECQKGLQALLQENWSGAVANYSDAIRANPKNSLAYAHRALARFMQVLFAHKHVVGSWGDGYVVKDKNEIVNLKQAVLNDLNKAIELEPKSARLVRNRLQFNFWSSSGTAQNMRDDCLLIHKLTNDDVISLAVAGWLLSSMDRSNTALTMLNDAAKAQPHASQVWAIRGDVLWRNNDIQNAITDETKALSLEPDNKFALYLRGLAYISDHKFAAAIADLTKLEKLEPRYGNVINERALAKFSMGDYKGTIEDATTILKTHPAFDANVLRASAYLKLSKPELAIADCNSALKLKPRASKIYVIRATARSQTNNIQGAVSDVDTAIRLDPNNSAALALRGKLGGRTGDLEQSLADTVESQRTMQSTRSAETFGGNRNGYLRTMESPDEKKVRSSSNQTFQRGRLPNADAIKQAIAGYSKVISLGSREPENHYNRGILYLCLNDQSHAADDFDSCCKLGATARTLTLSRILEAFSLRAQSKMSEANRCLADPTLATVSDTFLKGLLALAQGKLSSEQLLHPDQSSSQQTEIHLIAGISSRLYGAKTEAKKHLAWIRDHADLGSDEYTLGLSELNRLEKAEKR